MGAVVENIQDEPENLLYHHGAYFPGDRVSPPLEAGFWLGSGDCRSIDAGLIEPRRADPINVFHVHNDNRILAFHRWLEGIGRDVVVVASLNEATFYNYLLGFPGSGRWLEVFNSDVYDHWVNPWAAGNGGAVHADGSPMHNLPHSASLVVPANSVLVFSRDAGD